MALGSPLGFLNHLDKAVGRILVFLHLALQTFNIHLVLVRLSN